MKLSLAQKIKLHNYYRFFEKGNDFMTSFLFLGTRSPIFGVIGLSANILKVIMKYSKVRANDLLSTWHCANYSHKVTNYLENALSKYSVLNNKKEDNLELYIFNNITIVWCDDQFWFESEDAKNEVLKNLFTANNSLQLISKKHSFDIVSINQDKILFSKRAEDYYERLKIFLSNGHSRSALFYGPPGTGKTSIVLYIADKYIKQYGGKILHINLKDFEDFNPTDIQMFLDFIKCEVLVIDDIDQFSDIGSLLKLLETNRQRHRLILATANQMLSKAARRPERFDETFEINDLPVEILETTFSDLNELLSDEHRETVLKWPIAYASELNLRMKNLINYFDLDYEMTDLQSRLDIDDSFQDTESKSRRKTMHRYKFMSDED